MQKNYTRRRGDVKRSRRPTSHHFRAAVMAFSKTRKAIRNDSRLSEGIATRGRASISFYLPDKKNTKSTFFSHSNLRPNRHGFCLVEACMSRLPIGAG